jgi:type 1 glutamine amidotransferase
MDWVRSYGRGRVYTTMLGHTWQNEDKPNFRCRAFQAAILRAL